MLQKALSQTSPSKPCAKKNRSEKSRTVYFGGVTETISPTHIFDYVKSVVREGDFLVEELRILCQKSCAFLDFYDEETADRWMEKAKRKRFSVDGVNVRVSWATSSSAQRDYILNTAIKHGATRSLFIGNLSAPQVEDEKMFRSQFERFGVIETFKIVRQSEEKIFAFAHYCSIKECMAANLEMSTRWPENRFSFAKDRCSARREQGQINDDAAKDIGKSETAPSSRTIYIGDVGEDIKSEQLADCIHGAQGGLEKIRILRDKRCAFISFLDPKWAAKWFEMICHKHSNDGLAENIGHNNPTLCIHGKHHKIAWASGNDHVPGKVLNAIRKGVTRCLSISQIQTLNISSAFFTEIFPDALQIESIQINQKNVQIYFDDILFALSAFEICLLHESLSKCSLGFGRDRCSLGSLFVGQNLYQNQTQQSQLSMPLMYPMIIPPFTKSEGTEAESTVVSGSCPLYYPPPMPYTVHSPYTPTQNINRKALIDEQSENHPLLQSPLNKKKRKM